MPLYIGFDPGGTGKKVAYVAAAIDRDHRLFVGRLRSVNRGVPTFQPTTFPYLDVASIQAVHDALDATLRGILSSAGPAVAEGADLRSIALERYSAIVVSVDAPSGFAMSASGPRDTERAGRPNFRTPSEATFLTQSTAWVAAQNMAALHAQIYWKLMGFAIYAYFSDATAAAHVASATSQGINSSLAIPANATVSGIRMFESFPSETYGVPSVAARQVTDAFARRVLVNLPTTPVHRTTFAAFGQRLNAVVQSPSRAWTRSPRLQVGDCLDAFATMMLGPWAATVGLRALGRDRRALQAEGAIVVPP